MILAALLLATAAPALADERALAAAINGYRRQHGLPPVPLSPAMTAVARAHVLDLGANGPDTEADGGDCTMHSWSARGAWTPVCYTRDHARAAQMWSKPREITRGGYRSEGYEIAFWWSGEATPALALDAWQRSPAHDAVIRERGVWAKANWQAMGVALRGNYAVAWFGKARDTTR